ncbi:uncharacterized protein VP01_366g6 [Puccinia sorghi]|uniref:Uncharacterized protein n=1 Tax=Puccinia sorghi TaxID=27349 RepID=A0A0L6UUD6_9BASI|nr:uncharacterized protein VP01_366g6 [Puccinia sorghi]
MGQTNADACHSQQKIHTQGAEFRCQHLSPNYADNPKITSRLDSLIASIVKAEKTNLASFIQAGLTNGEAPKPVSYLAKLVTSVYMTMDPCFKDRSEPEVNSNPSITKGAKVRLAYLQFLFNQHRILFARNPGQKTPSVWELANQDLQDCCRKQAQTANFAFTELIIERNHQLWDGIKTINNIPEEDQQLRTVANIATRVMEYTKTPESSNSATTK